MQYQMSLRRPVTVDGINFYNGRKNNAVFHPADENTGLVFRFKGAGIPASLHNAYVSSFFGARCISLRGGGETVHFVEHLLSALYALGIDNLVIELSDGVCPTADNGAAEVFQALKCEKTGQQAKKTFLHYIKSSPAIVRQEPDAVSVYPRLQASWSFRISADVCYPHKAIGKQSYCFDVNEENYENEIMKARSPAFLGSKLMKSVVLATNRFGLHGINGKNYLLVTSEEDREYANPEVYGVRYGGEEFVRHKILDALGTLALTGRQFKNTGFNFSITGHEFTLKALRRLFDDGLFSEAVEL